MNTAEASRPFRILTAAGSERLTLEEARCIVGITRIWLPVAEIVCQKCGRTGLEHNHHRPLCVEYDGARRLAYCLSCASELLMDAPLSDGIARLSQEPTAAELLEVLKGHRIMVPRRERQPGERTIGEILRERAARDQAAGPADPTLRLVNFPAEPEAA